ncbi:MAG: MarC family protein [Candidatus Promineifilaceae bacterium]|nr:MarC family protein [Candidatus Promineifilaceae bacterium]
MLDLKEILDVNEYLKLLVGLLVIVDPLGNIPVYLGLVDKTTAKEKRQIVIVGSFAFIAILITFTFLGEAILDFFGIQLGAFQIAGGVLLLLMALEMMRQRHPIPMSEDEQQAGKASLGVVPLAVPLLAGPGAISIIIIFSHRHESISHNILLSGVILTVGIIIFVSLTLAPRIGAILGPTGRSIVERIMGLMVAAIAIEFMVDGLVSLFPALGR